MQFTKTYFNEVLKLIEDINENDQDLIDQAAQVLFDATTNGHKIYTFGTGHSYMPGQDIYARAGGYADIHPILEIEMTLLTHPTKSTRLERTADYADVLETLYPVESGDVVIASSNSGRNALVIEYLLRLKERGVKVIAITSLSHAKTITSRHESGLRLFELGDVVLDNRAPYGDATTTLSEEVKMGPISTLSSCFLSQLVIGAFCEKLIEAKLPCPVFRSSNMDNADAYNQTLFNQYILK